MSSIGSESAEPSNGRSPGRSLAAGEGAVRTSSNRAVSALSGENRLGGGVALATIGGALMTVGATVHAGERSSIWLNAFWDAGSVLVLVGVAVVLAMLCKGARLSATFRQKRSQGAIRLRRRIADDRLDALPPRPLPGVQFRQSPVLLRIVDEDWKVIDGRLWVLALAVTFINMADKPITLVRFTLENHDRHDRISDHIDEKISHKADAEFERMMASRGSELFAPDLVLAPLVPVTKWLTASALPLVEGGRPECLLRFEDALGDTYDVQLDRRPIQRFHTR